MFSNQKGFLNILISFFLIAGIAIGVYLIGQKTGLFSKAASSDLPEKVIISNLTDTSFTVSWLTPNAASDEFIAYGVSEPLKQSAGDDRGGLSRYTHHITLNRLSPNTEYLLRISGDPQNPIFRQKTAETLAEDPPVLFDTFNGSAVTPDGKKSEDAIIYLTVEGGQVLSTTTGKDGAWSLPLTTAGTEDLSSYQKLDSTTPIELLAISGLDGAGYSKVFEFAKEKSMDIILSNQRLPFYVIQLGRKSYAPSSANPSSGSSSTSDKSNRSLLETIWVTFTGGAK